MATDSPLALARSQVPKAARQIVPAFLQKLYQMVSDDKDRDLICWSEAGDSFFVLDHERFAREVLGHWFKHQRFSSFVRQLNMYGFHKIPHLQQGVLRSDSDTEYWNFTHPNFRRDQPDLLCLIQRKKQSAAVAQDGAIDIRDPNTPTAPATANAPATVSSPSPAISLTQGQLLDMHSILQGIAAIKRHQTTISSELTELKQSNQILYSESLIARNKLQKQQELIDRILKFLAGVFGTSHGASTGSGGGGTGHRGRRNASSDELDALMRGSDANRAVVPRRRQSSGGRLMIEGAKVNETSGKPGIVELEDLREGPMGDEEEEDARMMDNHYAVETPISVPSPSSSENAAAAAAIIGETKDRPASGTNPTPFNTSNASIPAQPPSPSASNTTSPQTNTRLELERALTPTNHHNNTFEINQSWANMLGGRNAITNDQLTHLLAFLAQTGPTVPSTNPSGFDEPLVGFDHPTAAAPGYDVGDMGFGGGGGFGGQGVVQPGQIQGGQPSSTGGNQLTYSPPSGFDVTSFLQNLSPPHSAGVPPLPSTSSSTLQQQQHPGLSPYGLLEDALHHPPHDEPGGLITFDSSSSPHNAMDAGGLVAPSTRIERQFQSTQDVEKEVNEMNEEMNHWIEQLGPILGNAGGDGEVGSRAGEAVIPSNTTTTTTTHDGLENLDFDSILHNMTISSHQNEVSSHSHGEGDDDFLDEDEDEEVDEEEEMVEENEGSRGRVNGVRPVMKKADRSLSKTSSPTITTTGGGGGGGGGGGSGSKKRKSVMEGGGFDERNEEGVVSMSKETSVPATTMTTRGVKAKRRKG